jgi:hypothetical protein
MERFVRNSRFGLAQRVLGKTNSIKSNLKRSFSYAKDYNSNRVLSVECIHGFESREWCGYCKKKSSNNQAGAKKRKKSSQTNVRKKKKAIPRTKKGKGSVWVVASAGLPSLGRKR